MGADVGAGDQVGLAGHFDRQLAPLDPFHLVGATSAARFDDLFFVDLPTHREREEILSIHLRRRGRDPLQFRIAELAAQSERLTGAELEQAVISGLYAAFADSRELRETDLENAIHETVPLYDTYEERIKELRDWGIGRTRPASVDAKIVELFAPS